MAYRAGLALLKQSAAAVATSREGHRKRQQPNLYRHREPARSLIYPGYEARFSTSVRSPDTSRRDCASALTGYRSHHDSECS